MPGGVNSPVRAFTAVGGSPPFIARGSGAHLTDVDGRRYVDYVMSWPPGGGFLPRYRCKGGDDVQIIGGGKVPKSRVKRGNMAPGKIAEQLSNLAIHSAEAGLERGSPLPVVGRGRGIELPQGGGDALHHAHGVRNREPVVRIDQAVMRRRRQGNLRLARPPMCRMDLLLRFRLAYFLPFRESL